MPPGTKTTFITDTANSPCLRGNANKSLGTGDVTINDGVGLVIGAAGAMDVGASLYLNGRGHHLAENRKLRLNADIQVFALYIGGNKIPDGVYDKDSGLVDSVNGNPLITGNGKLTVKGPPAGTVLLIK